MSSIIKRPMVSLATAGMLCLGLSRTGVAQMADPLETVRIEAATVTVYRTQAEPIVPAAKSETRGQAPSRDAVWVPGFWSLQGDRNTASRAGWVWLPGRWLTPPFRGASWVPAHWGWSDDWWSWRAGYWSKHNIFLQPQLQ